MIWMILIFFAIIYFHGFHPFNKIFSFIFSILFPTDNQRVTAENVLIFIIIPLLGVIFMIIESNSYDGWTKIVPRAYLFIVIWSFLIIKNLSFFLRNLESITNSKILSSLLTILTLIDLLIFFNSKAAIVVMALVVELLIFNLIIFLKKNI
ncbi:hypothetical protein SAMN05660964_03809 [Thiothrix caldifontis]|uniref:Uncharacterized protein n=1 Tax=Thiothrix caldifontis TaxID=525918 RepID=A0A1H4GY74_9GAMM|nr:hypothetical protein [Thiothrix caldifontis]SEB14525.1 hypothetical protein SAMN05660964_03809 [Thiothrix caldifontis]